VCHPRMIQGMSIFTTIIHIPGMIMITGMVATIIRIGGDIWDHIQIIGGIRMDAGGRQDGISVFLITITIGEGILDTMAQTMDMAIMGGIQDGLFQSDPMIGIRLDW